MDIFYYIYRTQNYKSMYLSIFNTTAEAYEAYNTIPLYLLV